MLNIIIKKAVSVLSAIVFVGLTASTRTTVDDESGGYTTAVNTIQKYVGANIEVTDDFSLFDQDDVTNWLITDNEKSDDYALWCIDNVPKDVVILFVFNNDTKVVMAAEADKTFVTSDFEIDVAFKSKENQKALNHTAGAFAWCFENEARAILNSQAGYNCSSIWALERTSNKVSLAWYDSLNSYWESYSNPENPSD